MGTWNLQNYLLSLRFPEGRFRPDYPKPEAEKQRLREILRQSRPDILFIQELGSAAFLRELQLDLAAGGLDYPFTGFSGVPGTRSGLGFLSRIEPDQVIFHDPLLTESGLPLPRGLQEVRFILQGCSWRFFHVHLKSRWSDDPSDPDATIPRREGLAALAAFLRRIRAADPDSRAVLVGDFNTPHDSPLLNPLRADWIRLLPAGPSGLRYTYTHRKSASREILDGFWILQPGILQPLAILPAGASSAPSDHRLVLVELSDPSDSPDPSDKSDFPDN